MRRIFTTAASSGIGLAARKNGPNILDEQVESLYPVNAPSGTFDSPTQPTALSKS